MELIPAIDILDGQCVRLRQGNPKNVEVYFNNPLTAVQQFLDLGLNWIHVVDLDAALGFGQNTALIARIIEKSDINIQIGGGIRSLKKAKEYFALGAKRLVLGTLPIKKPKVAEKIVSEIGSENIAIAIDEKNGQVSYSGWQDTSTRDYLDYAISLDEKEYGALIYTSTSRDGTLQGPPIAKINLLTEKVSAPIIASGGVGELDDLIQLKQTRASGVIIGKALYEKQFSIREAKKVLDDAY